MFEGHLGSIHVSRNPFRPKLFGDCPQEHIALETTAENLNALTEMEHLHDLAHLLMVVIVLAVETLRRSSTAHRAVIPRENDSPSTLCALQELSISGVTIIHHIDSHHTQLFCKFPQHRISEELSRKRHGDLSICSGSPHVGDPSRSLSWDLKGDHDKGTTTYPLFACRLSQAIL